MLFDDLMPAAGGAAPAKGAGAPVADSGGLFGDLVPAQAPAASDRGMGDIFGSAISRGWSQNVGLLTEALPALAYSVTGNDADAQRKLGEYQARLAEIAKTNPAVIESFSKIGSLGDAVTYLAEAVGENLPSMVPGLGGAGLGALAGRTLAKSAAGTAAGMTAGAVAGSAAQNIPETFADVAQETGQQRPGVAMAFGGLKAGLDAIPSVMALKRAFGPAITDKIAGGILKRMGVGAAEQFAAEGATEGAQEALDIAASKYVDENRELFTGANLNRIIDAGLKGGLGGAALGAGTGAIGRRPSIPDQQATPDQGPVLSETHREYLRQMGLSDQAIDEDLVRAQTWAERVAARRADDQRRAGFGPEGDWEGMAEDAAGVASGEMDPGAQRQTGRPPVVPPDEPIVVTPSGAAFPPGDLGAIEGAAQYGPVHQAAKHYVDLTERLGTDPGQLVEQTLQIPAAQFQTMPIPARDRLVQVALEARQAQQPGPPLQVQDTSGQGPTSAAPAPMREARAAPLAGAAENPMARVQPTSAEIDASPKRRYSQQGVGGSERPFPAGQDSSGLDFTRDQQGNPVDPRAALFEQRAQTQYETARQQTVDGLEREWAERARAREGQGPRYGGAGQAYSSTMGGDRFSAYPKDVDADGNYPVDQWGFILSTKGGPVKFTDQRKAAQWIVQHGNRRTRDQIFEIENHPSGKGFTVRERGRRDPPPGGRGPASYGVPATTNPSRARPSPAGRAESAAPVAPTAQASGAAPNPPDAPQPAPASPQEPAAPKRAEPRTKKGRGPASLWEFIASRGGIKDTDGELKAMGITSKRLVPGAGPLVRAQGLSYDAMREAAEEAGYIRSRDADTTTTPRDLLDAIGKEMPYWTAQRGTKRKDTRIYAAADEGEAETRRQERTAEQYDRRDELERTAGSIGLDYDPSISDAELERAINARVAELEGDITPSEPYQGPDDLSAGIPGFEPGIDRTPIGDQYVVPGAERIKDREMAERQGQKPLRSDAEQKPADEGLFDTEGRKQTDMFALGKRPSETRAGSPGGEAVGATIQTRPETSDQRKQATDSLRQILRRLAGDKIDVKVVDRIIGDDANFDDAGGFFTADEGRRIIYIAMASPDEMAAVLRHETIHALRDLGIIGPKDWRALENQAARWRKKYQTDKYYGGLGLSQEKLNEEAIAEAYADWVRGQYKPTSVVENVFRQIKAFFEALRNWAQGNGWKTASDVFDAIEGGGMSQAEFDRTPITRNNAFNRATPGARVFYRGTNPGDRRRIVSPFEDGSVFMADNIDDARLYGSAIERIEAKPDAKILTENTPEFARVTGRRDVLRSLRKGQSYADGLREATDAARRAGFDAVQFESQGDVGTVVLNNNAFNRGSSNAFAMSRAAITQQAHGVLDMIKNIGSTMDRLNNPLVTLPGDWRNYFEMRGMAKGEIQRIQDHLAGMRDLIGLPKAERDAALRYMTTKGAAPSLITDPQKRAKFVEMKQEIVKLGQALVDAGMLNEATFRANKDSYLPRVYLKFVLDEAANRKGVGTGARVSQQSYLKQRQDIPEDVRKLVYGEIDDPGFLAVRSISIVATDLAKFKLLQQVSDNPDWVANPKDQFVEFRKKKYTPQALKAQADQLRRMVDQLPEDRRAASLKMALEMEKFANTKLQAQPEFSKDYKQIPDTARYGSLRGLWVRKEIFNDMIGTFATPNPDPSWAEQVLGMGGWATKATQWWKFGKVVANPPSIARNLMSGMIQSNVFGRIPFAYIPMRYTQAVQEIIHNGKHWQIAQKYGIKGSGFAQNESAKIERAFLAYQKQQGGTKTVRNLARFKDMIAHVMDVASDGYQFIESVGKTAVIIDAMERQGLSERDAMILAEEAQFDYSNVSPAVRYLRNSPIGMPFVSYLSKVAPQLIKTAATRPWAYWPYVSMAVGLPMLTQYMLDIDKDELERLKKTLPEWARESGSVYLMPFRDSAGRWHYWNAGYVLPWGQFQDAAYKALAGKPMEAAKGMGLFGAPLVSLMTAVQTGIDPFTRREIYNKGDAPGKQWRDISLYLWSMAMPPWMGSTGFAKKLHDAALDVPIDKQGNPSATMTQALSGIVGVSLYGLDPEVNRQKNLAQMKYEIDQIKRRRGSVVKDARIKPDDKKAYLDEINAHLAEKQKEMAEYARDTNVAAKLKVPPK